MDQQEATQFQPFQLSPELVELVQEEKRRQQELEDQQELVHNEMWDAIYKAYPSLDREMNYTMDLKYLKQGVVMLDETKDRCPPGLKEILKEVIAKKK